MWSNIPLMYLFRGRHICFMKQFSVLAVSDAIGKISPGPWMKHTSTRLAVSNICYYARAVRHFTICTYVAYSSVVIYNRPMSGNVCGRCHGGYYSRLGISCILFIVKQSTWCRGLWVCYRLGRRHWSSLWLSMIMKLGAHREQFLVIRIWAVWHQVSRVLVTGHTENIPIFRPEHWGRIWLSRASSS